MSTLKHQADDKFLAVEDYVVEDYELLDRMIELHDFEDEADEKAEEEFSEEIEAAVDFYINALIKDLRCDRKRSQTRS